MYTQAPATPRFLAYSKEHEISPALTENGRSSLGLDLMLDIEHCAGCGAPSARRAVWIRRTRGWASQADPKEKRVASKTSLTDAFL